MDDDPAIGAGRLASAARRAWEVARGHVWTVLPWLRSTLVPRDDPRDAPWSIAVDDPQRGRVRVTGALREVPGAEAIAVLVHGLGGDAASPYCLQAADVLQARGVASLRPNLRGADGLGEDYYHAGLVGDLDAMLRDAALSGYRRVVVIGFSLGGHLALWHALAPDPRVTAIAAVCSPLDLEASTTAIDRRRSTAYRHHVLSQLKQHYRAVAARHPVPCPPDDADRIATIREWDRRTVAPRHGFASAEDYYARASVGPHLRRAAVRTLWLGARHDPMIPWSTVEPSLSAAEDAIEVHAVEGGHVGFPAGFFEMLADTVLRR